MRITEIIIFLQGHDTTASGLTFCFMLLANHKNVQVGLVTVVYYCSLYIVVFFCYQDAKTLI